MAAGRGELGLDHTGTLSQGDRLKNAAEDLDSVGRALGKDLGLPFGGVLPGFLLGLGGDERFGEYGADTAFPSFAAAWNEEVGVLAEALRQIRKKIGNGVATTSGTDRFTGSAMESLTPFGGGGR